MVEETTLFEIDRISVMDLAQVRKALEVAVAIKVFFPLTIAGTK